jgi:hypothetical protein
MYGTLIQQSSTVGLRKSKKKLQCLNRRGNKLKEIIACFAIYYSLATIPPPPLQISKHLSYLSASLSSPCVTYTDCLCKLTGEGVELSNLRPGRKLAWASSNTLRLMLKTRLEADTFVAKLLVLD